MQNLIERRPRPSVMATIRFLFVFSCLTALSCSDGPARPEPDDEPLSDPGPVLSFTWDDCDVSVFTYGFPVCKKHGIVCTVYMATGKAGERGFLSVDNLRTLYGAGWEIASHSVTHPHLTEISDDRLEYELVASKEILEAWGFSPTDFATPYGDYNDRVLDAIAEHYVSNRNTRIGFNYPKGYRYDLLCLAYNLNDNTDVLLLLGIINRLYESNAWGILVGHQVGPGGISPEELEALIIYAKARGFSILTVAEAIDKFMAVDSSGESLVPPSCLGLPGPVGSSLSLYRGDGAPPGVP